VAAVDFLCVTLKTLVMIASIRPSNILQNDWFRFGRPIMQGNAGPGT